MCMDQSGGLVGKDTYLQAWWPKFEPWDPRRGMGEATLTVCPLISIYVYLTKQVNKQKEV